MNQAFVVAKKLGKSFGRKIILEDLTFEVNAGDVIGVLGENGAGKTTLLEMILGFSPASEGLLEVFGHDSYNLPGESKQRIGFVPQQDELLNPLTVADQFRLVGSFYKNWDSTLMEKLMDAWGLDSNERIKNMSVGQRQKLSILLSLGHRPDLLLLDEPMASLDPIARRHFLEQIIEVSSDGAHAVIFSSHIVADIERLANKIWIIKDRKLYWAGDFDDLKDSVVRLHFHGDKDSLSSLKIPNTLTFEYSGTHARAIVYEWNETLHEEIVRNCGTKIEIEPLTLEEIFLEMHR